MNYPSRSQGGGVYVGSGAVVSFSGCEIYDNEATGNYVSFCPAPFHGPHGSSFQEMSLVLAGRRRVHRKRSSGLQRVQHL